MIKFHLKVISMLPMLFLACGFHGQKLLKHNYIRPDYDLNTIDTLMLTRVYTSFYDNGVFGYYRDSLSEKKGWRQVPVKMKRKLKEYGITLTTLCDTNDSVHVCEPTKQIITADEEYDKKLIEYLRKFEKRKYKGVPGCTCGNRYVAVVFHFGTTRTEANKFLNNLYHYPIDILTLGHYKIRWNEGYSRMRLVIYDCVKEQVVFNGLNSRYIIPDDSISVNKHLEILLAKYKEKSDELSRDTLESDHGDKKDE